MGRRAAGRAGRSDRSSQEGATTARRSPRGGPLAGGGYRGRADLVRYVRPRPGGAERDDPSEGGVVQPDATPGLRASSGTYLRWHLLDHMPEQFQLPGIQHTLRYTADAELVAARIAEQGAPGGCRQPHALPGGRPGSSRPRRTSWSSAPSSGSWADSRTTRPSLQVRPARAVAAVRRPSGVGVERGPPVAGPSGRRPDHRGASWR